MNSCPPLSMLSVSLKNSAAHLNSQNPDSSQSPTGIVSATLGAQLNTELNGQRANRLFDNAAGPSTLNLAHAKEARQWYNLAEHLHDQGLVSIGIDRFLDKKGCYEKAASLCPDIAVYWLRLSENMNPHDTATVNGKNHSREACLKNAGTLLHIAKVAGIFKAQSASKPNPARRSQTAPAKLTF